MGETLKCEKKMRNKMFILFSSSKCTIFWILFCPHSDILYWSDL